MHAYMCFCCCSNLINNIPLFIFNYNPVNLINLMILVTLYYNTALVIENYPLAIPIAKPVLKSRHYFRLHSENTS